MTEFSGLHAICMHLFLSNFFFFIFFFLKNFDEQKSYISNSDMLKRGGIEVD